MKNLILVLGFLLSTSLFAETYNYQGYYDEHYEEMIDFKVTVETKSLAYQKIEVVSVKIWGVEKDKDVLLFNIDGKKLKVELNDLGIIKIRTLKHVKPVSKKYYMPYHSDTGIDPDDEYSMSFAIDRRGSVGDYGFDLTNETQEEMALNGFLKVIR